MAKKILAVVSLTENFHGSIQLLLLGLKSVFQ